MDQLESYAEEHPHFFNPWTYPGFLVDAIQSRSGTYLDIGAGDGGKIQTLLSDGILKRYDRIIATDLSQTRVESIRKNVPGVDAVIADAQALPFPDASMDFIFSDQVIEHVPDDAAMAKEAARLLRPNGMAYIGSVLKLPGAWYFYRNKGKWCIDPTHEREYETEDEYRRIFESVGLQVIKMEVGPVLFPVVEVALRALMRFGVLSRSKAMEASFSLRYAGSIRIPRYRSIGALLSSSNT